MPIITRRSFSSCLPFKGFWTPVAGLAFRLWSFSRQSVTSLSVLKRMLVLGELSLRLPLLSTQSHGVPWHACVENYKCLFLNKTNCLPLKTFFSLPLGVRMLHLSFRHDSTLEREILRLCANFCSEIHDPILKISFGQEIFADASPRRDNSELPCLEYKSQYPRYG